MRFFSIIHPFLPLPKEAQVVRRSKNVISFVLQSVTVWINPKEGVDSDLVLGYYLMFP